MNDGRFEKVYIFLLKLRDCSFHFFFEVTKELFQLHRISRWYRSLEDIYRYLPVFLLLFSLFFLDKGSSLPPSSSRGILNNERSLYWSQFTQLLPIKVNRDCYLLNNPVSGSKCNANIRRIPAAIIGDRFRNNRSFRINFCSDIALIRSNTFPGIEYTRREISSPSAFHFRWILTTRSKQIEGEISRYFRKIAILDCWPRDWQKKKIKKDVHIKNYYNRSGQ